MRTRTGVLSGIVMAVALTLVSPPLAYADDAGFIDKAHTLGITNSDVNIISAGRSVCYVLRLGNRPPEEISGKIARNFVLTADQARQFSLFSANEWCPQWSGLFAS